MIQQLIDEGVVKLYHDYRRRDALDLSGNSNDGTLKNTPSFNRNGIECVTGNVNVADSAELHLTEGTIVMLVDLKKRETYDVLFSKRDISDTDYELYLTASTVAFKSDSGTSTSASDVRGKKYIAINFKSGEKPVGYLDGIVMGTAFSANATITNHSKPITIGAEYSYDVWPETTIGACMVISRQLTATEHAELYGYLSSLKFPSKTDAKPKIQDPQLTTNAGCCGQTDWTDTNGDGVADDWASSGAGFENPAIVTGNGFIGNAQRWERNGGVGPGGMVYSGIIMSGKTYKLSLKYRSDVSIVSGTGNYSYGTIPASSTTATYYEAIFTAGVGSGLNLFANGGGFVEIDEVSLIEVGASNWKTDWAANVSDAAVSAGFLENTPFVHGSGTHKISMDTINGQDVKVIECVTDGFVYVDMSQFMTAAENAYATTEWWLYKPDAKQSNIQFATNTATANSGYGIRVDTDETIYLAEFGVGYVITSGTAATADTWQKYKVTRSAAGLFTIYLNDASIGTGTDTTITSARYMVLDMDAGEKIAYSDISGNHSIVKKLT